MQRFFWHIIIALLAMAVLVIARTCYPSQSNIVNGQIVSSKIVYPHPRFEHLAREKHGKEDRDFDTWHDRETGQEVVCVHDYHEVSCYLTGRIW